MLIARPDNGDEEARVGSARTLDAFGNVMVTFDGVTLSAFSPEQVDVIVKEIALGALGPPGRIDFDGADETWTNGGTAFKVGSLDAQLRPAPLLEPPLPELMLTMDIGGTTSLVPAATAVTDLRIPTVPWKMTTQQVNIACAAAGAKAQQRPERLTLAMQMISTGRRPILSASTPKKKDPKNCPVKRQTG